MSTTPPPTVSTHGQLHIHSDIPLLQPFSAQNDHKSQFPEQNTPNSTLNPKKASNNNRATQELPQGQEKSQQSRKNEQEQHEDLENQQENQQETEETEETEENQQSQENQSWFEWTLGKIDIMGGFFVNLFGIEGDYQYVIDAVKRSEEDKIDKDLYPNN